MLLGYGVSILAGTILGKHCVVGTELFLRDNTRDYSVIVGVPGKVIKQYDTETNEWRKC